jgi:hypothetical protein
MSSQQNSLITVAVNGTPLGVWDRRSGGESAAELGKYRPGGMARQKVRKGLPVVGDLTVAREFEFDRDIELLRWLRTVVGTAQVTVNSQPLDDAATPFGKPTTWTGTLNSANGGDEDSDSNDGRDFELGITVAEVN